ncbi:MAG TPA: hypothetical protein VF739_04415 [Ktedonobacterales bacterium]
MAYRNAAEEYYLETWKRLLGALLGWPPDDVLRWAARFDEALGDPEDILYHASPPYWIASLLIPAELTKRLSSLEYVHLEQRIVMALEDRRLGNIPVDSDWLPFRARINQLLAEYGARLPDKPQQ